MIESALDIRTFDDDYCLGIKEIGVHPRCAVKNAKQLNGVDPKIPKLLFLICNLTIAR